MKFASSSLKSRERIAQVGLRFIQDGSVILMHGQSEVLTGPYHMAFATQHTVNLSFKKIITINYFIK